jgi:hypothetical protein
VAYLLLEGKIVARAAAELLSVDRVAVRVVAKARLLQMISAHRHLMISTMIFRFR